jgi:hypothetical protein
VKAAIKWLVLGIGLIVGSCFNLSGTPQGFAIGVVIASATGCLFAWLLVRDSKPTPKIDPTMITLRRMSIRLRYLSQEGTLSKTGNTVRFDAEGPDSANEFIDTIMAIVEAAE